MILMKNTITINPTFFKFILVGILNTLFGYLVFSLLISLGLHYYLAIFFASCLGTLFNFKTYGKLVFNNSKNTALWKFIFVYAIMYLLNIVIVKSLLYIDINIYIAGAIAIMITTICSYLLNKNWVFQVG